MNATTTESGLTEDGVAIITRTVETAKRIGMVQYNIVRVGASLQEDQRNTKFNSQARGSQHEQSDKEANRRKKKR